MTDRPATIQSATLKAQLLESFNRDLDASVAWFRANMPDYYFQVTSPGERIRHLELLHSMRRMGETRLTMVDDAERGQVTFAGKPTPRMLAEALDLLGERPFQRLELHTARDRSLRLIAFIQDEHRTPDASLDLSRRHDDVVRLTCTGEECLTRQVVDRYLQGVDPGYLARSQPERVARHVRAWVGLDDPEGVFIQADHHDEDGLHLTRILIAGAFTRAAWLRTLAALCAGDLLFLHRAYLDLVPALSGRGNTLIATIYVVDGDAKPLQGAALERVLHELKGLRRSFPGKMQGLYRSSSLSEEQFAVLAAATDCVAQFLAAEHAFLDVREVARDAIVQFPELCGRIATLVAWRFGPRPADAATWEAERSRILSELRALGNPATVAVLEALLGFVTAIRATNVFRPGRLGQGFQLDPGLLPAEQFPQQPYGVFFFHGGSGYGFHIRFRASARGGLRLLIPRTEVQLARSRDSLLREVYDLAWAQQLKNKDIPEGGAKCIALVLPGTGGSDDERADAMVKQLVDSLLDLILPAAQVPEVTGPHGARRAEELIFLGPDENMTPARIVWVAERAAARRLPRYLTLMSSKPGAGINHKEYGVTSEGIYRWVPHVLRALELDQAPIWTLKMTGGPDGDVGGNLIKVLHREERDRCRIIALGDGTGCAADPEGLDWNELLRLFREAKGIAHFAPGKLRGVGAHVTPAVDKASEELRNQLHNRVRADLFIPCGGRPYTINDKNWQDFLVDGRPSAKAMIEGANIFITAKAREELQRQGLIAIKDSSANKGGVICSSYEILAGLVMDEAEFLAIKPRYVRETIERLCAFAEQEADAILSAWRRRRGSVLLSDLSQQMSQEINRISGLLEPLIRNRLEQPELAAVWAREVEAHCPAVLVERYADRLALRIPVEHRIALLAKRYASRMLYREGLTWCRSYLSDEGAEATFVNYLEADRAVQDLGRAIAALPQVSIAGDELLPAILDGARRELVRRRLGH